MPGQRDSLRGLFRIVEHDAQVLWVGDIRVEEGFRTALPPDIEHGAADFRARMEEALRALCAEEDERFLGAPVDPQLRQEKTSLRNSLRPLFRELERNCQTVWTGTAPEQRAAEFCTRVEATLRAFRAEAEGLIAELDAWVEANAVPRPRRPGEKSAVEMLLGDPDDETWLSKWEFDDLVCQKGGSSTTFARRKAMTGQENLDQTTSGLIPTASEPFPVARARAVPFTKSQVLALREITLEHLPLVRAQRDAAGSRRAAEDLLAGVPGAAMRDPRATPVHRLAAHVIDLLALHPESNHTADASTPAEIEGTRKRLPALEARIVAAARELADLADTPLPAWVARMHAEPVQQPPPAPAEGRQERRARRHALVMEERRARGEHGAYFRVAVQELGTGAAGRELERVAAQVGRDFKFVESLRRGRAIRR